MEEIVLKRLANVTSAEALDQISDSYPDSEVFSFRRVKEAGNDAEYFVVRLRVATDHPEDLYDATAPLPEEDGSEDEKLDQIIDMLKNLTGEEEMEQEDDVVVDDMPVENDQPAPLPEPEKPPMGTAGVGTAVGPTFANIVVERPANVPQALARIELMREFGEDHTIESIEKDGSVFRAVLAAKKPDYKFPLGEYATRYMNWLRDQGVSSDDLWRVRDFITNFGGNYQDKVIRDRFWDKEKNDFAMPRTVELPNRGEATPEQEELAELYDEDADQGLPGLEDQRKNIEDDVFWADMDSESAGLSDFNPAEGNILDLANAAMSGRVSPGNVYNAYREMTMMRRKNDMAQKVRQQQGDMQIQQAPTTQVQAEPQRGEEVPF